MNERIRELAHKADFINKRHNGDFWRWGYIDPELNFQLEKFAQLIVAECVDIVEHSRIQGDEGVCLVGATKNKIKHLFGVEE